MTKSTSLHFSMLLILLVFAHLSKSEATSFRGVNSFDSRQIFSKLGYDLSKMKHDNRRILTGTDQIAPGGPDPQHHKKSPNMS
ncbi:hypothetical protein L1987_28926 [Smallanthus sonchifolius]|uniref:Uncharacterized protein n=1 Tax=Smallanthus sonchifolius TaxID=185202 RepID=A0ACB9HY11_9ASTR|nr:hypothetical protein L1987_28926 [Smallanthus sonchifolius]